MENFFVDDTFYRDVEDYIEGTELDEDLIKAIADDWKCPIFECELMPIVKLSADWICERIDEDMITEDGENVEQLEDVLNKYIDFAKVNSMIPKVYVPKGPRTFLKKQDLLDAL